MEFVKYFTDPSPCTTYAGTVAHELKLVLFITMLTRPVAESHDAVMSKGLPFLKNKAAQYRLI